MPWLRSAVGVWLVAAVVPAGCRNLADPVGKSPLRPARMSPDSVVLEVFFVRFPFGEPEANGPLWDEIDEMQLPAEVRQRLGRNGFRVGLVGGQVPTALSKLMDLKDKPAPGSQSLEKRVVDLEHEPHVVRRHMEVRAGCRTEIVASDIQDEMPVLLSNASGLEGEIFRKAQAVLVATAFPQPDGRVRVELVPEVHYGDNRLRRVIAPGMVRLESGKRKRVFDEMAIQCALAPGNMLVLSTLPSRAGSLGYRFFTQDANGQREQKLLIVRLAQTQNDELFDSPGVLPLDDVAHEAISPCRD
jgi:hypothetical protein